MRERQQTATEAAEHAARTAAQRSYTVARSAASELAAPAAALQACDEAWAARARAARSALGAATRDRPFLASAFEAACTQARRNPAHCVPSRCAQLT